MSFEATIGQTLSGFLVPVVAIAGVWIARQQARTNRMRLKHEFFDRRYEIYQAVTSFMADIGREGACSHQRSFQFLRETKGAEFIFGNDIKTYVDVLYSRSTKLTLHTTMQEHEKEMKDVLWFAEELNNASEVFKEYLQLEH